jgi:quercetin dioxygenase-like cupin family protein
MINRRLFVSCALCAATGLVARAVNAQTPTPGIVRTILQRMDAPEPGYEIILAEGDVPAGAMVAWHTHFGVETAIILEGSGTLMMHGQANRSVIVNTSFQVPTALPHALQNGGAPMRIASTYVVEKGKPLAVPAAE